MFYELTQGGEKPFELEMEEIFIQEEFRKRQEAAKWRWDLKSSVWGAGNIPHFSFFFFSHTEGVKSQAPFNGFLSFPKLLLNKNFFPFELKWLYPAWVSS